MRGETESDYAASYRVQSNKPKQKFRTSSAALLTTTATGSTLQEENLHQFLSRRKPDSRSRSYAKEGKKKGGNEKEKYESQDVEYAHGTSATMALVRSVCQTLR
jgi:hypothetical protein